MKRMTRLAAGILMSAAAAANAAQGSTISAAIANAHRAAANSERDVSRKPSQVLDFIALKAGDVVLDYGSGGGYWAELFSGVVGPEGRIYAHQRAGERFESQREALTAQFVPFGNIELMAVAAGAPFPLDDSSVNTVMLSYIYHHLHYAEDAGEALPPASAALLAEFRRVLKPGGTFIVIEHVAAEGSTRAESASWHRAPPATAKADITAAGFEFVDEAPGLFRNPDDNLRNVWFETGLRGKTTTFVHKYRKPN